MVLTPATWGDLVANMPGPRACTPAGILGTAETLPNPDAEAARGGGGAQRNRRRTGVPAAVDLSMPPSPSVIPKRPTCQRCAARPISWWPPSAAPP